MPSFKRITDVGQGVAGIVFAVFLLTFAIMMSPQIITLLMYAGHYTPHVAKSVRKGAGEAFSSMMFVPALVYFGLVLSIVIYCSTSAIAKFKVEEEDDKLDSKA